MNRKKEALERIKILFNEAELNPKKADRYVELARKIGMKINLPIPKEFKRKYCKHCNSYYHKGNYRVRTRNKMVVYYCLNCKKFSKFPMKLRIRKA